MKYTTISGTDLRVSVICLGTWVFGGDMWGGAQDGESCDAVCAAIDSGINFIDTAPIYGLGISEKIIGRAIKGRSENLVIATKCGLQKKGSRVIVDLSASSIRSEVDASLKRLQVDCIDLYQCHWPDPNTPIQETIDALLDIKAQGKIRHIGVSNFTAELLNKASAHAPIVTNQVQYSLLDRSIEKETLPQCRSRDIWVLAYGPLGGGILSGKYRDETTFSSADARNFFYTYYSGESFAVAQKIIVAMRTIPRPMSQVAINWVRQQPGVVSVIVGCRNPRQLSENIQAVTWELSSDELCALSSAVPSVSGG